MTDQNNPDPQGSEAPSVPEKFQDADGNLDGAKLLQSYNELQAQFTQNRQAPKDNGSPRIPDARSDGPLTLDSFSDFFAEYAENGELSDESWSALEAKTGMHRDVIQDYAESKNLAQAYQTQKLYEPYGGEEAVTEALAWAGTSMAQDKIDRLNAALEQGGEGGALALETVINEFNAATGGVKPVSMREGQRAPGGTRGFTTKAERLTALRAAKQSGDYTEYDSRLNATKDPASLT